MTEGRRDQHSTPTADDASPTSYLSGQLRSVTLTKGNIVDTTFLNSQINVVGGDLITHHNTNITVQSTTNEDYGRLIAIVNNHTRQETTSGICEDFKNENLQEPDFEVFPQMRQVDVDDYYKGRHQIANLSDVEIHRESRETYARNQLKEEVGFYHQRGNEGESITMKELIGSISKTDKLTPDDEVGITAIVASAGSGKTTLTRRIARKALEIDSAKDKGQGISVTEPRGKMIHYIELKDVKKEDSIKASNFLFGGLFELEHEENQAFNWLVEHQSDAVLIFDGLDQASWNFEEDSVRKLKPYQKASTSTIMYNIMARNILRHVKIFVASREFKISELPALARPQYIITLTGFTLQDAHKLFTYLIKEKIGEEVWKTIETISPRLLQLVSVPIFLILVAVVMGRDPNRPPPSTVTELYNRIISVLQSVDNIRNRKQILSIIKKLKALAFYGMEDGRVVFDDSDLKRFEVSATEVQDLMTKLPGNNILSRHLMEGDFRYLFCHQSMQEFLAASFVSEMDLEVFTRFNEIHLHEKRWSVVRRFVTGIVYMKSPCDLHTISDQREKKQTLHRSIRSQLEKKTKWENRYIRMELYTTIYESDDDEMMKPLSVIDASFISLSRDEAHIIGSLAARSQCLYSLDLVGCDINDEILGIIARCLKDRINVKELNLYANKFSATALRSLLGHDQIESLSGKLDWNVVGLTTQEYYFKLKNEENIIEIWGNDFVGHFNIKESTIVFVRILAPVVFCWRLFDTEFIKLDEQHHLYARQRDLTELSKSKLEKMSKILLDCTDGEYINWSLIEASLKNYQIKVMDIVVNGETSAEENKRNFERGREVFGFHGNIHAMFYYKRGDDFGNIVETCQQNKIHYIRCMFDDGCTSVDMISSLVKNSNSRKVTLIYWYTYEMLRGDELTKVQKIADDIDTELEVSCMYGRVDDAWQRLDNEFHSREYEKSWRIHKR